MSAYSDLILASASLRAYYRMDDLVFTTCDDIGPNNLNGSYAVTGVTYGVSGAIVNDSNTAVTFAGTSDAASVSDNNALDLGDGPFSLECWAKRSATQSAVQGLVTKSLTGGYNLQFGSTNRIGLTRFGGGQVVRSSVAVTDTNWHHIVATKNGSARTIYLDGADLTDLQTNETFTDTTGSLFIGHHGGANRFPGSVDEIAIYGAVLTPTEVLNHYEMGLGIRRLVGASVGTGTVAGGLVIGRPLAGISAGQGTASADLAVAHPLEGSSAGTGTATGDLAFLHALVGTSTGTSTVAGDVTVSRSLAGTSAGTGTASGDLTGSWLLAGTSTGVGTATGALTASVPSWPQDTETTWPVLAGTNWPQDTDNEWS